MREAGRGVCLGGAAGAMPPGGIGKLRLGHRLVVLAALSQAAFLLAGCASEDWTHDHLGRLDRISAHAGDAQARNIRIQSVDPVPDGDAERRRVYDGRRAKAVMDRYYGLESGPAETSGTDAAGEAGAGAGAEP